MENKNNKKEEKVEKVFFFIEKIFWSAISIYTIIMLLIFSFDYISKEIFVDFLSTKIFYMIIGFEVIKMTFLRISGKSNTLLAYHFSIMVMLTFAREIVLKHNLSIEIMIGFLLSSLIITITWYLSHKLIKCD